MKQFKRIAWVAVLCGMTPAIWAAATPDSEHINKLLTDAKAAALTVKQDTAAMEGFTRMNVSWEAHATAINQIRDHFNELTRVAKTLNDVKEEGAPWQQAAITRMAPYLEEMQGYTLAVIERINEEPRRLFTPEYKDFLAANADYSADLATMISDFVAYGSARGNVERLAVKLEIPAR